MPLRPGLYVTLWAPFSLLSETQESMCGRTTWLSEQPGKMAVVGVLWWTRSWKRYKKCLELETLFCIWNMSHRVKTLLTPFRALTDIGCSLSEEAWARDQAWFGPHTSDLITLNSTCRRGSLLPHYSPWPTPYSLRVNVFAQPIPTKHNVCLFPF